MANRGVLGLYLGRVTDHQASTYRFYNLTTNRVILSRNAKFMNQMHQDYFKNEKGTTNIYEVLSPVDDDDEKESDEEIDANESFDNNDNTINDNDSLPQLVPDDEVEKSSHEEKDNATNTRSNTNNPMYTTPQMNSKLSRELKKLDGFFNPEVMKILHDTTTTTTQTTDLDTIDDSETPPIFSTETDDNPTPSPLTVIEDEMSDDVMIPPTPHIIDRALVMVERIPKHKIVPKNENENPFDVQMTQLKDILETPTNYEEAYYHEDPWCRARWRAAIKLELDKMSLLKVWHAVDKATVPKDRRLIKNKWVFDIKRTGVFCARLVACGYSQIPGIDFQESYSPVVNDAVFRIIIILQIIWKLPAVIIDIETAFLHGELNESIYMMAPKGTNLKNHECVHLDKALYGLVQAARQFYIKFANVLKQLNFTISYADPCLFYRNDRHGKIIMVVHIDDCYVVGDKSAIKHLVYQLHENGLKTKVSPQATDYLSCEIKIDYANQLGWIGQPTLMNKMIKKFSPIIEKLNMKYEYRTPGTPGYLLEKPANDIGLLSLADQTLYRSGVGTLLQFANKTRPDIANPVRELSKGMDKATPAAMKEMLRIIKYVISTKDNGLKVKPTNLMNKKWRLRIFSDSDWASSKDNRKSITGFVIFLQESPILWKSQSQKCVSLSSTEAEYYACSEAVKEIKFLVQVMESLD
jgi:Reverse transcriptase (RNA-dependent DNA polymerase)